MREIFQNKHFVVSLDEEARVLRRARTTERFESMAELEVAYAELIAAISRPDCSTLGQLIDARSAPPRNDPVFEAAVTRHHKALYGIFRATAVLVRTAAGKLQVKRMLDSSGIDAPVFVEEEAALAYLRDAVRR